MISAKWVVLWSLWAARLARQPTTPLRVSGGRVRGSVAHDGSHIAFLGIPYATVTPDNIFQAPGPEPTWEGVLDAVENNIMCIQRTMIGGIPMGRENCLTLNVYTPVFLSDTKLPVMAFIHGGGFFEGSGTPLLYGPSFLVPKGVILVTFNYRLYAQGFLDLGIKEAPGNAGMKDQVAALKWIRKNIRAFGGDPDNVTLFGESAGAAAVSLHLLSPMSAGLFHKAIAQSGSSLASWTIQENPRYNAEIAAKIMGYDTADPYELYDIFKNMPLEEQAKIKFNTDVNKVIVSRVIYSPSIEKAFDGVESFLTKDPYQLLLNGEYNKVPTIIGTTDEEGYFFIGLESSLALSKAAMNIKDSLPNNLVFPSESERNRVAEETKEMYMGSEEISDSDIAKKKLSGFCGEPFFNYPAVAETELLLKTNDNPVYHYIFKYDGWRNYVKFISVKSLFKFPGASHFDDIFYIFSQPYSVTWFDTKIINRMTTLWTNFAKYGDPTPVTSELLPLRWPRVRQKDPQAMVLDRELSIIPMWHSESLKYWENVYSKYRARV